MGRVTGFGPDRFGSALCFFFPLFFGVAIAKLLLPSLIFLCFGDRMLCTGEFQTLVDCVCQFLSALNCFCCLLVDEVEGARREAESRFRFSQTRAVSMAPYDCSEMPWTSCPTHIESRILEATATVRLGGLRVAIRERMPVVEDHEVRYEVVAAVEDVWIEKSDEDDAEVVGDGSDQFVAEEKLGAMIENVLVTLPVLPNPRFLVRVATQEAAENKSLPISGENSPPRHGC